MNPQLIAIIERETKTHAYIEDLCTKVEGEDRNLSDAEMTLLEGWKADLENLKRQREPLEAIEQLREQHEAATRLPVPSRDSSKRAGLVTTEDRNPWPTAGHFMRDLVGSFPNPLNGHMADRDMASRISTYQTRAQQITSDTGGLLPELIVGSVITDMDESRPFIRSIGAKSLANIPGTTFNRPFVTQHALAGQQTAELTALPSQKMTITPIPFTKKTAGGTVTVSRQDIDWTDPSAWQILLDDLAAVYAEYTDGAAASSLQGAVTQSVTVASASAADWVKGLHDGVATILAGSARAGRLPNVLWQSPDSWSALGSEIDAARIQVSPTQTGLGSGGVATLNGTVLDIPRIMVATLAAGTSIIGRTTKTEFYEQRLGVISAVQPSVLGVEVAYGGYIAYGTLEATAFCKVMAPVGATRSKTASK